MAKRSYNVDTSERVKVSDEALSPSPSEAVPTSSPSEEAPETVRLVLLRDLKLNYTGAVTGKVYHFNGAGSVLPINIEDVEKMKEKHGGTCCEGSGSNQPHPYFAIV